MGEMANNLPQVCPLSFILCPSPGVGAPDYTVLIVAGGFSRRFGRDKANAPWQGRKLINHVAARVRTLGCEVIAVSRAEQNVAGWEVDRVIHDDPKAPDGPLRGVVCGLEACRTPWAFVVSCDAPRLQPALLLGLRRAATPDCLAVVPYWAGRMQPLMALYRTPSAGPLRAMLELGERAPARALRQLPHVRFLDAACRAIDPRGASFLNVNHPRDLEGAGLARRTEENPGPGSEPGHPST